MKYRDRQRVIRKLERLSAVDSDCRFYGVEKHRYRLARKLTKKQIAKLETRYGTPIPDDYRRFLTYVGNGGAGPGNGLERFGYIKSVADIPSARPKGPMRVIRETRHSTMMAQRLYDKFGRRVDPFDIAFYGIIRSLAPDGDVGPSAPSIPFPLKRPILNQFYSNPDPEWEDYNEAHGSICLAHYGCAMYARLILNGPFTGQVWLSDPNCGTFQPFAFNANLHYCEAEQPLKVDLKTTFTFTTWYEHWLDHTLAQVHLEYKTHS